MTTNPQTSGPAPAADPAPRRAAVASSAEIQSAPQGAPGAQPPPPSDKTEGSVLRAILKSVGTVRLFAQRWLPYNWVSPVVALFIVLFLARTPLFIGFEAQTLDARYQFRAPQDPEFDSRLVLGALDEKLVNKLKSWPIPREFYSQMIYAINKVGVPNVIALDIILNLHSGNIIGDSKLVDDAGMTPNFITGAASDVVSKVPDADSYFFGSTHPLTRITGDTSVVLGTPSAILPFKELRNASTFGFVNAPPGYADPARRLLPMIVRIGKNEKGEEFFFPSLVLRILAAYWNADEDRIEVELGKEIRITEGPDSIETPGRVHRIPINHKGEFYINYRNIRNTLDQPVVMSMGQILATAELIDDKIIRSEFELANVNVKPRPLKDKIILIGLTAVATSDLGVTPFGNQEPLAFIHLNALNSILRQDYVTFIPLWLQVATFLLLSTAVLFVLDRCALRTAVLIPFLIIGFYIATSILVFGTHSIILPIVWPVLGFGSVCVGSAYLRWQAEQAQRKRIENVFAKYVSPGVMKEVMSAPEKVNLGGASKAVSIMFSDIRGFTTISEAMGDAELVRQLNEYFDKMVGCVLRSKGTLHKYIGDAIMAVWGDVVEMTPEEGARNAVRCALDMRRELVKLNDFWIADKRLPQAIGIGINHGTVRVGNIGAPSRMEFTVIGDAVNFASRLEGVTKEFRTDLLIGESVRALIGDGFLLRTAGKILVKGKTEAITVYEVLCEADAPEHARLAPWVLLYEEAFAAFQQRNFAKALAGFEECIQEPGREKDFCCTQYIQACRDYLAEPPDESWTGVYVMKTK